MTIETDKINPDHLLNTESITAQVILIPIEAALYHNTGIDAATTEAACNDLTQPMGATAIDLTMTRHINHITDHHHIEDLQVIDPKIAVDHIHDHAVDLQDMNLADEIHTPERQEDHIPRRA